jgi:hypothetical protein
MLPLRIFYHLAAIALAIPLASSLGINCRGSGVCPLATFFAGAQSQGQDIVQGLRDALDRTTLPNTTTYGNGEHIVCVGTTIPISISIGPELLSVNLGGGIPAGGICGFPQNLQAGTTLSLQQIKTLANDIIQHGCNTCGSVPITFPNNQNVDSVGELTFNFVSEGNFVCDGKCISGQSNSAPVAASQGQTSSSTAAAASTASKLAIYTTSRK